MRSRGTGGTRGSANLTAGRRDIEREQEAERGLAEPERLKLD
jgi:hypothetical protein